MSYARTHLAKGVKDAVEDDKEWEHAQDRLKGTTNNEGEQRPQNKTEGHGLFTADAVHQKAADDGAREQEAIDHSAVANSLDERVIWVEFVENRGAKDAKGICLETSL